MLARPAAAAAVALGLLAVARGSQQPPLRQRPLVLGQAAARRSRPGSPAGYHVTSLREFPHAGAPWTQGLEFASDGRLVETCGDYPTGVGSFVRVLDRATGEALETSSEGLQAPVFIEGIAELAPGRWFASTYEDHEVLEYDADFHLRATHRFPMEGWGFARSPDGASFLATNGTEYVMTVDPATFEVTDAKVATCLGRRVSGLNELEMVDDFLGHGPKLLGNVINTRLVLVLDPATAECTGTFHLENLEPVDRTEASGFHVANGIAYDRERQTFIVTGKNWESMFEIRVSEAEGGAHGGSHALALLDQHLSDAPPFSAAQEATVSVHLHGAL